jgi:hypothetical protein
MRPGVRWGSGQARRHGGQEIAGASNCLKQSKFGNCEQRAGGDFSRRRVGADTGSEIWRVRRDTVVLLDYSRRSRSRKRIHSKNHRRKALLRSKSSEGARGPPAEPEGKPNTVKDRIFSTAPVRGRRGEKCTGFRKRPEDIGCGGVQPPVPAAVERRRLSSDDDPPKCVVFGAIGSFHRILTTVEPTRQTRALDQRRPGTAGTTRAARRCRREARSRALQLPHGRSSRTQRSADSG